MTETGYPFTPPDGRVYSVHAVFLEGGRRVVRTVACNAEILRVAEAVRDFRADAEAFASDRDREDLERKKRERAEESGRQASLLEEPRS